MSLDACLRALGASASLTESIKSSFGWVESIEDLSALAAADLEQLKAIAPTSLSPAQVLGIKQLLQSPDHVRSAITEAAGPDAASQARVDAHSDEDSPKASLHGDALVVPLEIGESTQVQGSKTATYTITRHPDRNGVPYFWCTCPSRKYHGARPGGDNSCKHIKALLQGIDVPVSHVSRPVKTPSKDEGDTTGSRRRSHVSRPCAKTVGHFEVALAGKYEPGKTNPIGMLVMEKYDGVFGHWDAMHQTLYSRQGNVIALPQAIQQQMPAFDVTGELYGGVNRFSEFAGLFNSGDVSDARWSQVKFIIFDVVQDELKTQNFETRMQYLSGFTNTNAEVVQLTKCTSIGQLDTMFNSVTSVGGEGLMLRKNVAYQGGRTADILKYKKMETTEGKVVGYTKGTGRFASFIGSVCLVNRDGGEFKCVPPDRTNPPAIGTIVEVECLELTAKGLPRHPRWKGVRHDVQW